MSSGLWGIGFVLVEMRVRKLMKRIMATPCGASTSCSRFSEKASQRADRGYAADAIPQVERLLPGSSACMMRSDARGEGRVDYGSIR